MPQTTTYPGVYVNIAPPQGARPIVGVATSITAMVLDLERGPIDVAVRVNPTTFVDTFGRPSPAYPHGYMVDQFFANGGSELYIVRASRPANPAEGILAASAATWEEGDWEMTAGRQVPGIEDPAIDPGSWGNRLRVEAVPGPDGTYDLIVTEQDSANPSQPLRSESFVGQTDATVEAQVGADSKLVFLAEAGTDLSTTGTYAETAPPSTDEGTPGLPMAIEVDSAEGTETLDVVFDVPSQSSQAIALAFQQAIRRAAASALTSDPDLIAPRYLRQATVRVIADRMYVTAGLFPGYDEAAKLTVSGGLGFAGASPPDSIGPIRYALSSGTDGAAPTELEIVGDPNRRTGLYALDRVDLFNILCLPGLAGVGAGLANTAYQEAGRYCEERRAFLIMDMSSNPVPINEPSEAEAWMQDAPKLANAAVYFPRVVYSVTNPDTRLPNALRFPNSALMAGIYARTDTNRGVWKAPAGIEADIRLVSELEYTMTDSENGYLNPLGCNALRQFPVSGMVPWGARTLRGADALADQHKYISIIRTTYFLAESLDRGTQWVVFEPNDEPLWSQIRLSVGAFMSQQFRKGAFQGTKASDAYFVKCDAETTTQADIDAGIVNIVVGFAPLKPAEFVIIEIQQMAREVT